MRIYATDMQEYSTNWAMTMNLYHLFTVLNKLLNGKKVRILDKTKKDNRQELK